MDKEFTNERVDAWGTWIGQPMFYDFGLFVNRTAEEHKVSEMYFRVRPTE